MEGGSLFCDVKSVEAEGVVVFMKDDEFWLKMEAMKI